MIHDQTKKYTWDAMEFEHREKTVDWYWGLGIAIVTGIILCIIFKNYLLAVLLAVGGLLMGFYGDKPHPHVRVEISERGIRMDKDLYTYETIQSFWMYTDHRNHNRLIIVTGRPVMPQRIVTIPDSLPAKDLRTYLMDHIPEKETKPSLLDLLTDIIGY
jgi:hypothetical protein